MKMSRQFKVIIGVFAIVLAVFAVSVWAATYIFNPSNTQTGTVNPTPAPTPTPTPAPVTVDTNLVLSPTTITFGETWTLTATLNQPLAGITVNFYEGATVASGTFIGSAVTDSAGTASLTFMPTLGNHTYIAQPT